MNVIRHLALAAFVTTGCAHVDVQTPSVCDGAHFASVASKKLEVVTIPPPVNVSLQTKFSAANLPNSTSLTIELSPMALSVQGGTWGFADALKVTMTGSDPTVDPALTVADYTVTPADARGSALSVPLAVPSSTFLSYLRDGPITLSLDMTAHAAPPGDIDLQVCHSASGSWSWNVVSGVH